MATRWDPDWTSELIDLLHVVAKLVELEPDQAALLDEIVDGALISVDDLTTAGVLPATARPVAESPPHQDQLV